MSEQTRKPSLIEQFERDCRAAIEEILKISQAGDYESGVAIWRKATRSTRKAIDAKVRSVMGDNWLPRLPASKRFGFFIEVAAAKRARDARKATQAGRVRAPKGGIMAGGRHYPAGSYMPWLTFDPSQMFTRRA